jgi:hypothetical protein
MATHGPGGLRRLILGSVATSTLRQTTVPLLLIRPSAMHQAEPDHGAEAGDESASETTAAVLMAAVTVESDRRMDVRLTPVNLEPIECGRTSLAQAQVYDYGHILAGRALAARLKESVQIVLGQPVAPGSDSIGREVGSNPTSRYATEGKRRCS